MTGKVNYPLDTNQCSSRNYGDVVRKKISDNPRYFAYLCRGLIKWLRINNEHTAVKRTFDRLKENLGLNDITVWGIRKTRVHVLYNFIALQ
ncbi:MAG: hypothetical protein ACOX22_02805 [Caldicoprobacterales bacterium]|jgi:hypothetical protein